ncbi:unnamed protein product [Phytomonas sp. EM1]|nr:unnamed protein product [Phytomonas sp. EM1]|eukprot:CCW63789.1 unnamed protein product [Phytomonas sp. isolate EM1]
MSTHVLRGNLEHEEQNHLLDQLHDSVMNTKHYAVEIGTTLQEHDAILDQLHGDISNTTDVSRRQNQRVVQLLRESKNRGFYAVVLVLVVIIIFLIII